MDTFVHRACQELGFGFAWKGAKPNRTLVHASRNALLAPRCGASRPHDFSRPLMAGALRLRYPTTVVRYPARRDVRVNCSQSFSRLAVLAPRPGWSAVAPTFCQYCNRPTATWEPLRCAISCARQRPPTRAVVRVRWTRQARRLASARRPSVSRTTPTRWGGRLSGPTAAECRGVPRRGYQVIDGWPRHLIADVRQLPHLAAQLPSEAVLWLP